jgi:hypothetical protein
MSKISNTNRGLLIFGVILGVGVFSPVVHAKKKIAREPASYSTQTVKGMTFALPQSNPFAAKDPSLGALDYPDFAKLERAYPLRAKDLDPLNPADLKGLTQEQLDQLYARLTAGPIPDGIFHGQILFTREGGLEGMAQGLVESKLPRLAVGANFAVLRKFGELMWKGKHFYQKEAILRNLIPNTKLQIGIFKGISLALLGVNPNFQNFPKTPDSNYFEAFPAKLYCGQSLLDSRRESIIIDYSHAKDLDQYNPSDVLATKDGLGVRDEIRMVRPGFYLGRAYMKGAFGLVFSLYNEEIAKKGDRTESCWTGYPVNQANR